MCPFAISNVSPPHPFLPLLLPLPWSKHLSSFACTIAVSSYSSPGPLCSVTSARGIFRSPCLFPRVKKAWWCHVILRLKSRSLRVAWKASSASGSPRPLLPSLPHAPPILSVFWHHLPCPGKRLALPPRPRAFVQAVPVCWNTLPNHPLAQTHPSCLSCGGCLRSPSKSLSESLLFPSTSEPHTTWILSVFPRAINCISM